MSIEHNHRVKNRFDSTLDGGVTLPQSGNLSLSIGGIGCSIVSQSTQFLDVLRKRYQWFESSEPAAYEVLLQIDSFADLVSEQAVSGQPSVKRIGTGDNYWIRQTHNPFFALVNTCSKKAIVKMWSSQYCFDSFLRLFYTLILAKEGGLLLHASAVVDGSKGTAFFGPSGSGKTTVARFSSGRTILTDELALIRPGAAGYEVYGTPFWGEFTPGRSNIQARLNGLYSLKKAQNNQLVPKDKVRAVMELYRCVLFFSHEASLLSRILDICCSLVDAVPVYDLHFKPDATFWQVVD